MRLDKQARRASHCRRRKPFRLRREPFGFAFESPVAAAIRVRYHEKSTRHGPVAQMGARVNGIHEVTGSIPVWSTISKSLILNY